MLNSFQMFVQDGMESLSGSQHALKLVKTHSAMIPTLVKLTHSLRAELAEKEEEIEKLNSTISTLMPQDSFTPASVAQQVVHSNDTNNSDESSDGTEKLDVVEEVHNGKDQDDDESSGNKKRKAADASSAAEDE